jgi:hypothetical protein
MFFINHSLKFKYPSQKDKARIKKEDEDDGGGNSEPQAKCLPAPKDNDTVRKYTEPPAKLSTLDNTDTVRYYITQVCP